MLRPAPLTGLILERDDAPEAGQADEEIVLDVIDSLVYNGSMTPTPKTVGLRELKTKLGSYLRQVKTGATLIVTERGCPVAELRPLEGFGDRDLDSRLRELIALGVISGEVERRAPLEPFEPVKSRGGLLSEAIREDREDRF